MLGLGVAFLVLLGLLSSSGSAKASPGGVPGGAPPPPPGGLPAGPPGGGGPPGPPGPPGPAPGGTQSTYVVQASDKKGPWGLAQAWMGDGNTGYRQLKAANPTLGAKWDAGSSWFAGMTINIPASWPPKPATISGASGAVAMTPELIGAMLPTLHAGSRGELVAHWQAFLGLRRDGIFGFNTQLATKRFQQNHRLIPDGVVGPQTWATAHRILMRRRQHGGI